MAKRPKTRKKEEQTLLERLLVRKIGREETSTSEDSQARPSEPQPSLETIGLTDCSVCGQEVSVMLTKTRHPFTACGRCGARTFYNSRVAIILLKDRLREVKVD